MSILRRLIFLIALAGLLLTSCGPRELETGSSGFVATECVEMAGLTLQQFTNPPAFFFVGPLMFVSPVATFAIIPEIADGNFDGSNELSVPFSFGPAQGGIQPMTMFLTNSPNGGFKQVMVILELGAVPAELRGFDSSGTQIVTDTVDESLAELILEGNGDIISYVEFHMSEALIQQICW